MNKAFLLYLGQKGPVFLCVAIFSSVFLCCLLDVIHEIITKGDNWKKKAILASVLLALSFVGEFIYSSPYLPFAT